MSLGNLLVSDYTSSIGDEDESDFDVLGEIKWEDIPRIRSEPGRMIEPGIWKFRIKGISLRQSIASVKGAKRHSACYERMATP